MPTKSPKADAPKTTQKSRAPRKTAKQRQEEAEQARQAAWASFETRRHVEWLEMWAKALRLHIITEHMTEFKETFGWWFEEFRVSAREQSFILDDIATRTISEEKLHPSEVDQINDALDRAFDWLKEFEEEKERQRLQAIEDERERKEALAKLTDRDKKLLGLTRF